MFMTLVVKELKSIILSPKFSVTFAVCSVLILLSVYAGVQEYHAARAGYETALQLAEDQAREASNWSHFSYTVLREPDPMGVFVSGLASDIGRWSAVDQSEAVKLRHSAYSDDPLFAMFRMVDFALIVQVVLSLLAILFTYDAVSGERENGTLKLIFANGVPRATYLLAKCVGSWMGLVVPLLIPMLLGVLIVQLSGIALTGFVLGRLVALIAVSLLFFSLFIVLGVLVSTLTRRSAVSFLVSLVLWIAIVLVIPRGGMMAAGQLIHVPRVAEIEGQRDGYAKDLWKAHYDAMEGRFIADRERDHEAGEEVDADLAMWDRMQREDSLRQQVETQIEAFETQLLDDLRRRKRQQQKLAFILSRLSPASAYQLAAMNLAGTDVDLKSRYEEAMTQYREEWSAHVQTKQAESGQMGGFVSVEISSETGLTIGGSRGDERIDISDMPRFQAPKLKLAEVLPPVLPDMGILAIGTLLAFLGAFVAFLRYDVR
jgi:ABC-type transport system involved in multi-copper enzyme maturation permease subunit